MRPFRAAVFDLDGTLLDSYEAIHASLSDAVASVGGRRVTLEETRRLVGNGLEALVAKVLPPELHVAALDRFRRHYRVNGPRLTKLMPGAELVVSELYRRRVLLGVASNKPSVFSRQLLDAFGLSELFAFIGGPDMGFPPKPAPEMALAAVAALGARPDETLFVGDMTIDVDTARAAGLAVAVAATGSSPRKELEAAGPDVLLESLADVLELFPRPPG